jgi:hypothetical protein
VSARGDGQTERRRAAARGGTTVNPRAAGIRGRAEAGAYRSETNLSPTAKLPELPAKLPELPPDLPELSELPPYLKPAIERAAGDAATTNWTTAELAALAELTAELATELTELAALAELTADLTDLAADLADLTAELAAELAGAGKSISAAGPAS